MPIAELIACATQEINTRIKMIQDQYEADMARRFNWLAKQINKKIVDDEFLGGTLVTNAYDYPRKEEKIAQFMTWLIEQEDKGILEII